MFKKLLISSIAISACGAEYKPTVFQMIGFSDFLEQKVDVDARPHFAEFVEYCKSSSSALQKTCLKNLTRFSSLRIESGPIAENTQIVGLCFVSVDGKERRVLIRGDVFDSESLSFKDLIWHELGHCLLDLPHWDDGSIHIMNANMPSETSIAYYWAHLSKEIFDPSSYK